MLNDGHLQPLEPEGDKPRSDVARDWPSDRVLSGRANDHPTPLWGNEPPISDTLRRALNRNVHVALNKEI